MSTLELRQLETLIIAVHIAIFIAFAAKNRNMPITKMSKIFGNLTYPVYLVHQNIGYILMAALAATLDEAIALAIVLFVVVALGYLINVVIEGHLTKYLKARL